MTAGFNTRTRAIKLARKHTIDLRSRAGVGSLLSTLLCLPVMILLLGLVAYVGRAYAARYALEDAAATGARFAQTSLGAGRACDQALASMRRVLAGHALDPGGVRLSAQTRSGAARVRTLEIRAEMTVDQSAIPVLGRLLGDTQLASRYVVAVDPHVSRQRYGWIGCATGTVSVSPPQAQAQEHGW
jgi:hypothetical protein